MEKGIPHGNGISMGKPAAASYSYSFIENTITILILSRDHGLALRLCSGASVLALFQYFVDL